MDDSSALMARDDLMRLSRMLRTSFRGASFGDFRVDDGIDAIDFAVRLIDTMIRDKGNQK